MIAAIVQARMGSRRFPGKIMEDLNGKSVIEHIIDKLEKFKTDGIIDKYIIATPDTPENKVFWEYLEKKNVKFFKGSNEDVLDRFYHCAKKYNIDTIVRICADFPFLKEWQIAQQVENFKKYKQFTYGNGAWVFSFNMLEESWKYGKHPEDREHVVTRMFNSIDYPDDLERIRKLNEN